MLVPWRVVKGPVSEKQTELEIGGTDATTVALFKVPSGLRPADQCGRWHGILGRDPCRIRTTKTAIAWKTLPKNRSGMGLALDVSFHFWNGCNMASAPHSRHWNKLRIYSDQTNPCVQATSKIIFSSLSAKLQKLRNPSQIDMISALVISHTPLQIFDSCQCFSFVPLNDSLAIPKADFNFASLWIPRNPAVENQLGGSTETYSPRPSIEGDELAFPEVQDFAAGRNQIFPIFFPKSWIL